MVSAYLIDMEEVEKSLRRVQADFHLINQTLDMRREQLRDDIVVNMLAGYRYVNFILQKDINLLKRSGFQHLLELNNTVLCGTDLKKRENYLGHIQTNSDRFYGQKEFCIGHIRDWAAKHENDSPWKLASGVYILNISRPQLFEEGNHRTGALLMSSILVRNGKPPFVLSVENAKAYFDPSSLAKSTYKNILGRYYKLPKIKKKFARFLKEQAHKKFILQAR